MLIRADFALLTIPQEHRWEMRRRHLGFLRRMSRMQRFRFHTASKGWRRMFPREMCVGEGQLEVHFQGTNYLNTDY